jgi:predicted nucleotidyltransferase
MRIDAIYLFGSYARNKADKFSDIDLLIVSPDFGDNLLENQLKLLRARRGIDYRIEPHPVLPEDLDSSVLFTLASSEMRKIV